MENAPSPPRLQLLPGPPGAARSARLAGLVASFPDAAAARRLDDAHLGHGGVWGPVAAWLRDLLPRLRAENPELFAARRRELELVLPELREDGLEGPKPSEAQPLNLTESARGGRRVRMFAADRVNRSVHGIVEVLGALTAGNGTWIVAWDHFETASELARRALLELAQRFGAANGLHFALTLPLDNAETAAAELAEFFGEAPLLHRIDEPALAAEPADPAAAAAASSREAKALAARLIQRLRHDEPILWQLAEQWQRAGDDCQWRQTLARLAICLNRLNYYQDGLPIARRVAPFALEVFGEEPERRFQLLIALYGILVATGNAAEALPLLERAELLGRQPPEAAAALQYMLAMLRARYLPHLQLDLAQGHLERAIDLAGASALPEAEQRFQRAFFRNGLALVHYRRGDTGEALRLCQENLAALAEEFAAGEQLLFCSILYQNLALVEAARGSYGDAFRAYGQAIEIDPAYPEYYNDRGSLALKVGRPDLAAADFARAVEIGPPFAEAFANLGQACRELGRLEEADAAYTTALELQPRLQLARIGRAQTRRLRGDNSAALLDYDRALAEDGRQPLVLANRGAIHYFESRFPDALADFDHALELAPELAALHRNRALVLDSLNRPEEAERARERGAELERAAAELAPAPPPLVMDSAEFHAGPPLL